VSLFMRKPAVVALGARRAALLPAGAALDKVLLEPIDAAKVETVAAALASLREQAKTGAVVVVLDDALAKLFVVRPAVGVKSLVELKSLVAARFEDLFGFEASSWCIEAAWQATRPFLACALPVALRAAVTGALPRCTSLTPAFVHALALPRPAHSAQWCVHRTADWATAAWIDARAGVQYARSAALPEHADLAPWLREEALLADRPLQSLFLVDVHARPLAAAGVQVQRPARLPSALRLLAQLRDVEAAT
jgi:hypothetical protein